MKYSSFGYKALAVGTALSLALVGCGGANEAATKTEEKAEEKTEQIEQQAEQKIKAVSWKDVATAEEAAKGAGFATFGVPASFQLGDLTFENPKFAYADGVAQATYETPATQVVIRKADGTHDAPMTDRELGEFANKWTTSLAGLDVALYGAQQDAATVMRWTDGTKDFGVTFQGLGGEEMSMSAVESEGLVTAIKDADAAPSTESAADANNGTPAEAESNAEDASAAVEEAPAPAPVAEQPANETSTGTETSNDAGSVTTTDDANTDVTDPSGEEVTNYPQHDWEDEVMADQADTYNMTAQFSKDQCTYNALSSVGAGDSAANVSTSDLITGGGTLYYLVEFDLTGAHYRVMVDAINGGIIDVMESVDGEVIDYS
jgi:hypothetical protein